ncbi:oxygen-independent coproporphyrinogen III oxidase [Microvirga sp. KLBC 81]|uniref:oxygen-independent coproporphyrinogen III oxidase n=1 Tax=Microvirga sp. KLBC 81 TaxID=1862707 RepID=UPI000D51046B|nr:oxygen-independent coproporphyrinogen III oxidase [Microvirga sp. KLBC 81]PVE22093.1 oxygen-independent coproporphyrinogen III oxidase [Microvirga sp. KLBC 81]
MTPELIARYDQRVPRYTSYPTAPHFKPDVDSATYAKWLSELSPQTALSLYLHVPFCAELCLYCGCHTTVARTYSPVASYVELLEREIELVAQHLPSRMGVTHIHWGGGTPTILSGDDLRRIMGLLERSFGIRPTAEIAVEIDPRTLTLEGVEALAASGLNRASLGVQDFDPKVQKTINRIQSFEQTAKVATWLRHAGVTGLNLDLMYGLPYQTTDSVLRTIQQALRLDPDRIALFGYAHVPWMKRHQALLPEEAMPDAIQRVEQNTAAAAALIEAGYVQIGLDHFAKPSDPMVVRQREGRLHRNFQGYTTDEASALIGFGTSAIGSLPQGYIQNASSTVAYREAITKGRLATARGVALTDDDRLRRSIIERLMCDFAVDLDRIASDRRKPDFTAELAVIDELARDGLVKRDGLSIEIPEDSRLLVRNICAAFDRYLESGAARHSRAV